MLTPIVHQTVDCVLHKGSEEQADEQGGGELEGRVGLDHGLRLTSVSSRGRKG